MSVIAGRGAAVSRCRNVWLRGRSVGSGRCQHRRRQPRPRRFSRSRPPRHYPRRSASDADVRRRHSLRRLGARRPELPCAATALGTPEPGSRIMVCHNVVTHSKTPVPHSCPTFRTGLTGPYNPVISQRSKAQIVGESRTGEGHSQLTPIAKALGYRDFRSYLPGISPPANRFARARPVLKGRGLR